jgi:signal transduction histidine kinase/FixJ family two-component response regulator/molybdopterin converting factor small subunit
MSKKILLVDDEEGIRKVLGISLTDMGYDVITAENGEEALSLFKQVAPPIVLTDIKMPGMDGITLLRTIKESSPDTEVIMITGHGDMDIAIKSLKYEATDFVTKPINDDVLEIALKRAHERIDMRRQIRDYTENLETMVKEQSARLVEVERLAAVGQAIEGLSSAIWSFAGGYEGGIQYFNEMPCLVAIHSRDLKIVAVNQLYKERLGDKVGLNSCAIYGKKASGRSECSVEKTFRTGKGYRSEEKIKYLSGEVPVIVHTAPIRSKDNEVELVLEISADATEVKRLREELKATRQRYKQLFDEAPCYITVQDKNYNVTAANRRFVEDFIDDKTLKCFEIYKQRQTICPNCPVEKTFKDGKSHQAETIVTSKTGEQINVIIWTAPIKNAAGEITQVMEMSTNITQMRKLEDHLSSLGLLIGSISHGIKGLLTGLDGGMYLVESGFSKENHEQVKEGWDIIKLMAGRIRGMVLDILYYAKHRDLKWEKVDVLSFAEDVATTIEPKVRTHQIELIRNFDRSTGGFEVDPGIVRSALINILENAIDACIEEKSGRDHKITFGVKQVKNHIVFDVSDNGIGMNSETKDKLFTLFFSSKGTRGTGLGLFISNRIIQQHGGFITVETSLGEGSHFSIMLPKLLPESLKTPHIDDENVSEGN